MYENLLENRTFIVNGKVSILRHYGAKPYMSIKTHQKLKNLNLKFLNHSPYFPDLSLTDFHVFKHLDIFMRDKVFKKQIEAQEAFEEFINSKKHSSINVEWNHYQNVGKSVSTRIENNLINKCCVTLSIYI